MATILVTGSTTGLGRLAGEALIARGHRVIFHARNSERARELTAAIGESGVVIGDLALLDDVVSLAEQVARLGTPDAVIHNAGVFVDAPERTAAGLPATFAVNVLAPYVLTALMNGPRQLVYLSSGMHRVTPREDDLLWTSRPWNGSRAYSESKFYLTALTFAVARLRPELSANAVDPGWVPTRMGGAGARDDLAAGYETQVLLASNPAALGSPTGDYFFHRTPQPPQPQTRDPALQARLIERLRTLSGVAL